MKKVTITSGIFILALMFFVGVTFAAGEKQMKEEKGMTQSGMEGSASQMMGKTVVGDQGEKLGTVERIVSGDDGKPKYVVISPEMSDQLIPIPYSFAQMEGDHVMLSGIDKQKLDNAPRFSQDEWNKLDERYFNQEIRGYYEPAKPGKSTGMPGETRFEERRAPGGDVRSGPQPQGNENIMND